MTNDKQRIANELNNGARHIGRKDGKYFLAYDNRNAFLHDRTFENVRSMLVEVEKDRWVLK